MTTLRGAVGAPVERVDARSKVTGEALYTYEYGADGVAYLALVQSTVAVGTITAFDTAAALAVPGVLAVLTHDNAPRLTALENAELHVLQSPRIAYRGQIVAAVVAERFEVAREAAALVQVDYEEEPHDAELRAGHPKLTRPETVLGFPTDTNEGDIDTALAEAAVTVDSWFRTPAQHALPMEPHASLVVWDGDSVTIYESSQFPARVQAAVAETFELPLEKVRVISRNVGGGFGSKTAPGPHMVVSIMAAKLVGRPVKTALTRRQMFPISGYRSPTVQRVRVGTDPTGRIVALAHEAYSQTSTLYDFVEPTAFDARVLYRADNRRTSHRVAALDVPTPGFVRGPGHVPGSFALESAIDELAERLGMDPIELRIANEPNVDPETKLPFSSRNLVACLREGADRFGWPRPQRRDGRWLIGSGVAAAHFPSYRQPSSATVRAETDGSFTVLIGATDIGTGAQTVLTQVAADELEVPLELVQVDLGDSRLPWAVGSVGSMGTSSWGSAVVEACRALKERLPDETAASANTGPALATTEQRFSTGAYGAQFAEVRVDAVTGEIHLSELLGVFAAGRIMSPRLARSQLIGGLTWGLGFALLEESVMDARFGDYVNSDLAAYHIPSCPDVEQIDVVWIDERDPHVNPMGSKGIGEIGAVGVAAAIANAAYAATGTRVFELPIRLDKLRAPVEPGGIL